MLEIFRNLQAMKEFMNIYYCNVDPQDLTVGKILYFFTNKENASPLAQVREDGNLVEEFMP